VEKRVSVRGGTEKMELATTTATANQAKRKPPLFSRRALCPRRRRSRKACLAASGIFLRSAFSLKATLGSVDGC
jgi:hypothetical protein